MKRSDRRENWKDRLQAVGPLGVSLLLHGLLGLGIARSYLPGQLASEQASPPPIRFELVDTPESALTEQSPDDPQLYSNKTTRAQDPTEKEPDQEETHRPQVLEDGVQKDLRPIAQASDLGPQPSVAPAPRPEASKPTIQEVTEELPDLEPSDDGMTPRMEEPQPRESPPRPPTPETAPGQALQQGMPQQGRRNPTPAERDELAKTLEAGEFSYAATQHFFADYLLQLRERIGSQWTLLVMTDFILPGKREAVVDFLVLADGRVDGLKTRKLVGEADFASICTKSIRDTAPFGPIPYHLVPGMNEDLEGTPLRIRFTFTYQ